MSEGNRRSFLGALAAGVVASLGLKWGTSELSIASDNVMLPLKTEETWTRRRESLSAITPAPDGWGTKNERWVARVTAIDIAEKSITLEGIGRWEKAVDVPYPLFRPFTPPGRRVSGTAVIMDEPMFHLFSVGKIVVVDDQCWTLYESFEKVFPFVHGYVQPPLSG